MKLDQQTHKTKLFQILSEISANTQIAPFLGFKGGTAAVLFYGLDRFSVDLDFDLLDPQKEEIVFAEVAKIARKYGTIKDEYKKRFNMIWVISYQDEARKLKIEINREPSNSQFTLRNILGVSVLLIEPEDMLANKLLAMAKRMNKTSRDIYDVWFFLKNDFKVNQEIIEAYTKTSLTEFSQKLVKSMEKFDNRRILTGLGELLTPSQKDWAKAKLKQETIALLTLRFLDHIPGR